jgi:hypothetical protein
MTLYNAVSGQAIFAQALSQYYAAGPDPATLAILDR